MGQEELAAGAIGAFVSLLLTKGVPALMTWLEWSDKKEDKHVNLAREGPMMVNAVLVQSVADAKVTILALQEKIDRLVTEQSACHESKAALAAKAEYLEKDNQELCEENAKLREENNRLRCER